MSEILLEDAGKYTVKIDNNDVLKSDIILTYEHFKSKKKKWEELQHSDKLKLIAYYFILIKKNKKIIINDEIIKKNPFPALVNGEAELTFIEEKQKIIKDIISKIDGQIVNINTLYDKHIKEFVSFLSEKEIEELKLIRAKLSKHFGV